MAVRMEKEICCLVPLVAQATEETRVFQSREENPQILNIWLKVSFFLQEIKERLKRLAVVSVLAVDLSR